MVVYTVLGGWGSLFGIHRIRHGDGPFFDRVFQQAPQTTYVSLFNKSSFLLRCSVFPVRDAQPLFVNFDSNFRRKAKAPLFEGNGPDNFSAVQPVAGVFLVDAETKAARIMTQIVKSSCRK